jgi:hypothetical protein
MKKITDRKIAWEILSRKTTVQEELLFDYNYSLLKFAKGSGLWAIIIDLR